VNVNPQAELMQRAIRILAQLPEPAPWMFVVTDQDGLEEEKPQMAALTITASHPDKVMRALGGEWEKALDPAWDMWRRLDGCLEVTVEGEAL